MVGYQIFSQLVSAEPPVVPLMTATHLVSRAFAEVNIVFIHVNSLIQCWKVIYTPSTHEHVHVCVHVLLLSKPFSYWGVPSGDVSSITLEACIGFSDHAEGMRASKSCPVVLVAQILPKAYLYSDKS